MEQPALRPKPMPGQDPGQDPGPDFSAGSGRGSGRGTRPGAPVRHPHAARKRARRLRTLLSGLLISAVLVLSGVGIGTLGATVIGLSKLADLRRQAPQRPPYAPHPGPAHPAKPTPASTTSSASPAPATATLGVEAVDAYRTGALIVGVHVPGPGYTAGLVRGDVLLAFDGTRVASAADLARAVAHARPGSEVSLKIRHRSGTYQWLTAVPGFVM